MKVSIFYFTCTNDVRYQLFLPDETKFVLRDSEVEEQFNMTVQKSLARVRDRARPLFHVSDVDLQMYVNPYIPMSF